MKKAMIEYAKKEVNDEFYTPRFAVEPLLKYIPKDKILWCPFDTEDSNYRKVGVWGSYNTPQIYFGDTWTPSDLCYNTCKDGDA